MLILTRKVGETIILDDCIEVTIVRIEGAKIRIGITAPPEIRALRKELVDKARVGTPVANR